MISPGHMAHQAPSNKQTEYSGYYLTINSEHLWKLSCYSSKNDSVLLSSTDISEWTIAGDCGDKNVGDKTKHGKLSKEKGHQWAYICQWVSGSSRLTSLTQFQLCCRISAYKLCIRWQDLNEAGFHAQLWIFRNTDLNFIKYCISARKQMLACKTLWFYSYS